MSVMDLTGVITAFTTGTAYPVTRQATADYGMDGRAVPGHITSLTISGMVAPLNGRDLQNLPEGMRTKQTRWFFSAGLLHTEEQGAFEPDVVTIDGDPYQVQSSTPYNALGNFYQYLLMRVGN